jgi:hypothetical protein
MRFSLKQGRWRPAVVLGLLSAATLVASAQAHDGMPQTGPPGMQQITGLAGMGGPNDPSMVGSFSKPFEEGGSKQPDCRRDEHGTIICKPTAVSEAMLKDGRILYWNGIEGDENSKVAFAVEGGKDVVNGRSRLLDMRGGKLNWSIPTKEDGGASNPQVKPGRSGPEDPQGYTGVPGRPGDGLVGSTAGNDNSSPSSPPDDRGKTPGHDNNGDMFCSYQVQLADGRILDLGGTDWYSEPGVPYSKQPQGAPNAGKGGQGPKAPTGQPGAPDPQGWGVIELEGLRSSRTFNPDTNSWQQQGNMKYGRWYPDAVKMPDGKVSVFSGVTKLAKSTQLSQVRRTETFDPKTGKWGENYRGPGSETSLPLFPRMWLTPNGKVFWDGNGQNWGPFGQAADEASFLQTKFWNPKTMMWENAGPGGPLLNRSGALDAALPMKPPYDKLSLVIAGGVFGPPPGTYAEAVPTTEQVTVDKQGHVDRQTKGNLNNPRWFTQGVSLPDGTLMAFNGGTRDEVIAPGTEQAVRQAEIYHPDTGKWTPAAMGHRDRTYHNTASLLPDGRVLVGGHRPITTGYTTHRDLVDNNDPDPSFEVYSPPYLFNGPRPTIKRADAGLAWGEKSKVDMADAGPIDSVMVTSQPALTHVTQSNQRSAYLPFKQDGNKLQITAPPNGLVTPPGFYYLFVNRKTPKGPVPSVAAIVQIGMGANHAAAIEPITNSLAAANTGSATEPFSSTANPPGGCPGCQGGK